MAWHQVGALTMKQVVGGQQSEQPSKAEPSLWIHLDPKNVIRVAVKQGDQTFFNQTIRAEMNLKKHLAVLVKKSPKIKQAFILPTSDIIYEDVIKVMDKVRQLGIFNVGISPL